MPALCHDHGYYITTRSHYECGQCHKITSLTSGTLFHATKLPLTKWFWAIYWVASDKGGISALRFSKLIGVNWRSAYSMLKKFRNSMGHRDSLYRLTDIIELDEALLVEKNRVSEVEELKVKSQYSLPVKAEIKSQGLLQWKLPVL